MISLNKYENLGKLSYEQVDENWDDIEEATERANVAELYGYSSNKIISPAVIKSALAWATYSASTTFTWSFNSYVNNFVTISGNVTFNLNTTTPPATPGKSCIIKVLGNNSTARTLTLGTGFKGPKKVFTGITNTKGVLISVLVDNATSVFASAMEFEE